jgi:hypothetical protein
MCKRAILLSMLLLLSVVPAKSEYVLQGKIRGTYCTGFVFKMCEDVRVTAVYKGARLYSIKNNWASVDDYDSTRGICTLRAKGSTFEFIKGGQRQSGEFETISAKCIKR